MAINWLTANYVLSLLSLVTYNMLQPHTVFTNVGILLLKLKANANLMLTDVKIAPQSELIFLKSTDNVDRKYLTLVVNVILTCYYYIVEVASLRCVLVLAPQPHRRRSWTVSFKTLCESFHIEQDMWPTLTKWRRWRGSPALSVRGVSAVEVYGISFVRNQKHVLGSKCKLIQLLKWWLFWISDLSLLVEWNLWTFCFLFLFRRHWSSWTRTRDLFY